MLNIYPTICDEKHGFLVIDRTGNCFLVKLLYMDTDTLVKDSFRSTGTIKELDEIVKYYCLTGEMLQKKKEV